MDSRRLVVWISAGILGFQGGTLVLDLIHCSVLSWLYLRRYGLKLVSTTHVQAGPPLDMAPNRPLWGLEVQPHDQPRSQHHRRFGGTWKMRRMIAISTPNWQVRL